MTRNVWAILILAICFAFVLMRPRAAASFVMANPDVAAAWHGTPGEPIASALSGYADVDLPKTLLGQARATAYFDAMLKQKATLDEAARYHFFAAPGAFTPSSDYPSVPAETGLRAASDARALADKIRDAEAPLDSAIGERFAALTDSLNKADSIELPRDPVFYCRWILYASGTSYTPLSLKIRRHCIEKRNAYIEAVVVRLADLAKIPTLDQPPPPPEAHTQMVGDPYLDPRLPRDLYLLPRAVLPGETADLMNVATLTSAFQNRLKARFDAALPQLREQLQRAVAERGVSDVIAVPELECRRLLGLYAGPLPTLPGAAAATADLWHSCMTAQHQQATRAIVLIKHEITDTLNAQIAKVPSIPLADAKIGGTPQWTCGQLLAPHLPNSGGYGGPSPGSIEGYSDLEQACIDLVTTQQHAVFERHLSAALEVSKPDTDTIEGWERHGWYAIPPGAGTWSTDWAILQSFNTAYQAAMSPRRSAAAARFVAEIKRAFTPDKGVETEQAQEACTGSYRIAGDDPFQILAGDTGRPAPTPPVDYDGKSDLSANEATTWVRMTCQYLHAVTTARRQTLALQNSGVADVMGHAERLAVLSPQGEANEIVPDKLVESAAMDGIQVSFQKGFWSDPTITITPFGRTSPAMSGKLKTITRPDGVEILEISGFPSFPGFDGPLDTVECVAIQVDRAYRAGRVQMFGAAAATLFDGAFLESEAMERGAMQNLLDVQRCKAAKRNFLRTN